MRCSNRKAEPARIFIAWAPYGSPVLGSVAGRRPSKRLDPGTIQVAPEAGAVWSLRA